MVKTLLTTSGSNTVATAPITTTANATQYTFLGNSIILFSNTEADREVTYRTAGTISKLFVRIDANGVLSGQGSRYRQGKKEQG